MARFVDRAGPARPGFVIVQVGRARFVDRAGPARPVHCDEVISRLRAVGHILIFS
jgi:hypothetical protein